MIAQIVQTMFVTFLSLLMLALVGIPISAAMWGDEEHSGVFATMFLWPLLLPLLILAFVFYLIKGTGKMFRYAWKGLFP